MIPIGTIHSPFTSLENMPIQPRGARSCIGSATLLPEYAAGLSDLEGFSHIYLLYQFHQAQRTELSVIPFMDSVERGIYATRSPLRPNHIGLSIVELISVDGPTLHFRGCDILNNTPLLDIKPYIASFDKVGESRSGWMQAPESDVEQCRSDNRFIS